MKVTQQLSLLLKKSGGAALLSLSSCEKGGVSD